MTWLDVANGIPVTKSAKRLAGVLQDSKGLKFTVTFVDEVVRPEDLRIAARALAKIAPDVPQFLPLHLKMLVRVGGIFAPMLPWLVVPMARKVLRGMVAHLIVDATNSKLTKTIRRLNAQKVRLNINLLGEAVLGKKEAAKRIAGTKRLLARSDVDYVSIKVSAAVAPHSPWAFREAVDHIAEELLPLYRLANESEPKKFVNLDMEEYKDLNLTIAVFTAILERPEFKNLTAGIVLQAYLPDSLPAMESLQHWAAQRVKDGGAPIKVRLVKGANLPMEKVEADMHGWPLATWAEKQETDAHYKRVLRYALDPLHIKNVRLGVAGHNLFDIAYAWLLAGELEVRDYLDFEMLLGMAPAQAEAVRQSVGKLILYTPVVAPREFDAAIAYLIRRLEEGAASENFMSAVFELTKKPELFEREKKRFSAALADIQKEIPVTKRVADRYAAVDMPSANHFVNTPDTDPAIGSNREWAEGILERARNTKIGLASLENSVITIAEVAEIIQDTRKAAKSWAALGATGRAKILERCGQTLATHRADFLEIMAHEAGKTLEQGDPEVSEAIDFAYYYAGQALELDHIDGATFTPAKLTVITPPWNFPLAIPAGSTLAALAAGSSVILKPARLTARTASLLAEALWEAGVPKDVLRFVITEDRETSSALVSDPGVDRVVLTGSYETAQLFKQLRPDLPLLAETSGKNAIIVTPSADFDLAVKDTVYSAFGHAGQKCSAASLVVLVGSAAHSKRFREQLFDATSSLIVGPATNPETQMGPIIDSPGVKLLSGLTKLSPGETWLLQPREIAPNVWTPGIRDGVKRGSEFHRVEYFGPILGIMSAATLEEAVEIVNDIDYGLTSGLHSLDSKEIEYWANHIEAGNLYVNRGTTGAIVRRQPFGGWKKSSVGAGTKAGGPNYLMGLGSWSSTKSDAPDAELVSEVEVFVNECIAVAYALDQEKLDFLSRSLQSDEQAWRNHFAAKDVSGLKYEQNIFRYRPTLLPVIIRLDVSANWAELVRVIAAALRAGSKTLVSTHQPLPERLAKAIKATTQLVVEDAAAWSARVAGTKSGRIRLIGASTEELQNPVYANPALAFFSGAVTESGRVELLPFLQEQSVSVTAHRFGTLREIPDFTAFV